MGIQQFRHRAAGVDQQRIDDLSADFVSVWTGVRDLACLPRRRSGLDNGHGRGELYDLRRWLGLGSENSPRRGAFQEMNALYSIYALETGNLTGAYVMSTNPDDLARAIPDK